MIPTRAEWIIGAVLLLSTLLWWGRIIRLLVLGVRWLWGRMHRGRALLALALCLVMVAVTLPRRAYAADEPAPYQETWTWRGNIGWTLRMTADQAKNSYETMDEWSAGGGSVALLAPLISGMFKRLAPPVGAVAATLSLGALALKRCSDRGEKGVVVYGIKIPHTEYDIRWDGESEPVITPVTVYRYVPYWCSQQS